MTEQEFDKYCQKVARTIKDPILLSDGMSFNHKHTAEIHNPYYEYVIKSTYVESFIKHYQEVEIEICNRSNNNTPRRRRHEIFTIHSMQHRKRR